MTKPVIYVIANKRAKMSAGKLAAQVGHAVASVIGSERYPQSDWLGHPHRWLIVLEGQDDVHLIAIHKYLHERHVRSHLIIDEGVNEVRPFTYTALGIQVLGKDTPEAGYLSGLTKYREDTSDLARKHYSEGYQAGWKARAFFRRWWRDQ